MNLDRETNGGDYGHPLNSDWNSEHSWNDCGHIDWGFFGTWIVCSGVGVGSGVGMTGGARGISNCRSLEMDYTALVVVPP